MKNYELENSISVNARFEGGKATHLADPEYRADIDGLRAVAVIGVIGYHAFPAWVKGGFVGVDIFFVISGFLISTVIFNSLQRDSFSFIEFYSRRIKRIFPALLFVLIASFSFGWFALLADEFKQLGKHIAGGAGFVSNFLFWNESGYFDNAADKKPLLHLWSLGVEEQFYIVWPVLLWIGYKSRLNLLAIVLIVAVSSFALGIDKVHSDAAAAFYSPQTRFWELLVGAGLAYTAGHRQHIALPHRSKFDEWLSSKINSQSLRLNWEIVRNVQSVLGVTLIGGSIFSINKEMQFPGWWAVLPTLGAALVISSGSQTWLNRAVLSSRALIWFGLISFPLYLWHWPWLSFAHIFEGETPEPLIRMAAVILSIVLAWLTYRFIEKPIRFGTQGRTVVVGLLLSMVVIGAMGHKVYVDVGISDREVVLKNVDIRQTDFSQSNPPSPCTNDAKFSLVSPFCHKFTAENSQSTIVLWGDSSAAAWQNVFLDIAKSKNYTIIVIAHEGCSPLLDVAARKTYVEDGGKSPYCGYGLIQEQALELINEFKPNATILVAAWNWLKPSQIDIQDGQSGKIDNYVDKRIFDTVKAFEKISRLIVFKSWPNLPKEPNYKISRIGFLQSETRRALLDVRDFIKDSEYIHSILDRSASSNTLFFSPSEKICAEKCVPILNGVRMYYDSYHITRQGSMQFRVEIEKLIDSALLPDLATRVNYAPALVNQPSR
jgi:peptidoglycan/LPS O-acetylase OafA/YrhL